MNENNKKNTPFLLIELLEKFSAKEINGLKQIVLSPYFNKDKYVIQLLDVLISKVLGKNRSNMQIQGILYQQVFNQAHSINAVLEKKQKSLLSAKMSALIKLAKRFLCVEALEHSKTNKSDLLLNALLEKKQFRLLDKEFKDEIKSGNEFIYDDYFDHMFRVEEVRLHYLHQNGNWIKKDNINELMRHLDIRYLSKKLELTSSALSMAEAKPSANYDLSILSLINSAYFEKYQDTDNLSLNVRVAVVSLMQDKSFKAYEQLLYILKENETKIPGDVLRNFYSIALNFCTQQSKKGHLEYFHHYVSVYKILDEKGLIAIGNIIHAGELKNIVVISCKIQQFDWVEGIINKYTPLINQAIRDNVNNFCLGYVAFHKKAYEQSIDYLLEMDNFNLRYDIDKRVMLIKSYFELDKHYLDPVAQLFRSFEAYIRNHKLINTKDKTGYKNFIRVALNLYRLKHKVGIIKIDTLKGIIDKATFVFNRPWLLEKIEELEKRK